MIKMHFRNLILCFVLTCTSCACTAAGQQKNKPDSQKNVDVPREIVQQLKNDEDYSDAIITRADGSAENLVANPTDLNRDGIPELIISGVNGNGSNTCAVNNCIHWIFGKSSSGYEMLLREDTVQMVEPQKAYTNGYRDIIMAHHSSGFEHYLSLFKFDGRRYKIASCFIRRYYQYLDGHGETQVAEKPEIIRVKCTDKQEH